jgi:hypothetical protein
MIEGILKLMQENESLQKENAELKSKLEKLEKKRGISVSEHVTPQEPYATILNMLKGESFCANFRFDGKKLPKDMLGVVYQGDGPITKEFAEKFFVIPLNCKVIEGETVVQNI